MAMTSFAFSIHNFISSVGADAGFAAVIGLAIVVLLYFVHARETANLREEAALLTQRLQHAEARVLQLTRAQALAEAEAVAAEAEPWDGMRVPFAPAGSGAPALGSATRMVPEAPQDAPAPAPAVQTPALAVAPAHSAAPALAMAGVAAPAAAVAAAPAAAPPANSTPPAPDPQGVPNAAPVPAMAPSPRPSVPGPATAAGGNGAAAPERNVDPAPGRPAAAPPASTPGRSRLAQLPPLEPRRSRRRVWRRVAVAVVAVAAVAAAIVLVAITSIGASNHPTTTPTTNAPASRHTAPVRAFKPSSVTVAVLNGTATNRLAHRTSDKLAALGYKQGAVATAANQTQTATIVAYRPGATNREDALHVASALGLRPSAVQPVDPNTLQVACPGSAPCTATVVVTVGSDLAGP